MEHFVYVVQCSDGTLYTGYTTDIEKRVATHNAEKGGAKYTNARKPVTLVYSEVCNSKPDALRREIEIKKLSRAEKLLLIDTR